MLTCVWHFCDSHVAETAMVLRERNWEGIGITYRGEIIIYRDRNTKKKKDRNTRCKSFIEKEGLFFPLVFAQMS